MSERYDIAIITVSHNDLSAACLASVQRAQRKSLLKTTVVVVDNASTQYFANEFVDEHLPGAICLLRNIDAGYGRSCNRGAREVEADYYFILNPDTVLIQETILDDLYAFARSHPESGIIAPQIAYPDGRLQDTCRRFPKWFVPILQRSRLGETACGKAYLRKFLMRDYPHAETRMVDWVQGSAMFIPGDLYKQIRGFDDQFWMYCEDMDLCHRAWQLHRPVYYAPSIRLEHGWGKASEGQGNIIMKFFRNPMSRAHLKSWIQYLWKWNVVPHFLNSKSVIARTRQSCQRLDGGDEAISP